MKKHVLPGFCLVLVVLLVSFCKKVNDKNPSLHGTWKGTEWLIEGQKKAAADMVQFEFQPDGTYKAQLGDGYSEIGVWRTDGDKLYTTAEGKQEIMVKMLKYDGQVLSFEMNRSGQKEILTLGKF